MNMPPKASRASPRARPACSDRAAAAGPASSSSSVVTSPASPAPTTTTTRARVGSGISPRYPLGRVVIATKALRITYAREVLVARDVEVTLASGVQILGPVSLDVAPGSADRADGDERVGQVDARCACSPASHQPSAGTATWADVPTELAVQALGYVPQRETVHDRLTTREALRYAATLRLAPDAAVDERVQSVLQELGLDEQADTLIRNLSGGERRRAACGLELVGDPHLLLLDEPTSGLDAVLERRLMHLFRRLADGGRAVLVVTHATASLDLCDEVVVLERGRRRTAAARAARSPTYGGIAGSSAARRPPPRAPGARGRRRRAAARQPAAAARRAPVRARAADARSRYWRTMTRDHRTLGSARQPR